MQLHPQLVTTVGLDITLALNWAFCPKICSVWHQLCKPGHSQCCPRLSCLKEKEYTTLNVLDDNSTVCITLGTPAGLRTNKSPSKVGSKKLFQGAGSEHWCWAMSCYTTDSNEISRIRLNLKGTCPMLVPAWIKSINSMVLLQLDIVNNSSIWIVFSINWTTDF